MSSNFDVIVIGGGPGGYVAAIRASQLGLKTCVVEDKHMGGICLNWGCIPTKALLKCSEINHTLHNLESYGFSVSDIKFDFTKIIKRSRDVSAQLSKGISGLMKKNKVEVITGFGSIKKSGVVSVLSDGKASEINGKYIILATGARPRVLKGFEPNEKLILTYKAAMVQESLPKKLCVVGSGAIGSEFASFYQNMGSQVTILEAAPKILPVEDDEISAIAHKSFTSQGIKIHTNAKLESVERKTSSVIVHFDGKKEEFDRLIMAVGVVQNIENIGIEKTNIKMEKSWIKTNPLCETDEKNIFAIGDITQGPWLAHKASHEGIIAAETIASREGKYDASKVHHLKRDCIPGCTYTRPQIASIGITEKIAKERGIDIKIGRFSPMGNGKSIAAGETEGLIKTIFCAKTGEILGVHMIGSEVTEMISTFALGKSSELVEEDFINTIFPHPSLSEMMHGSVLSAFGRALHM